MKIDVAMNDSPPKMERRMSGILDKVFFAAIVALVGAVVVHDRELAVHGNRLDNLPPAGLVEDVKEIKRSLEKMDDGFKVSLEKIDERLRKIEQTGGGK